MTSTAGGHGTGVSDTRDSRDALPGAEERTVTTDDGATLAVTVAPGTADTTGTAGPTVVFAHGWTNNRSVWWPVARRIAAEGHPVVLYDQRGHGASTLGTDLLGIERLGDDLSLLLEQLDLQDVVLVGHSMGGFTIMSFACRHRDMLDGRVRAMALVSTAAHGLSMGRMAPLAERLLRSRTVERVVRARSGLVFTRRVLGRRPLPQHVRSTRAMFLATPAEVRAGYFATFGGMDLRTCLADLDVPTAVVVGARDTLTPPRLGQVIAETIPGARYEVLPGAGHMLPFERTDEVVAEVLSLAR
jgi:pimeloyl-ACP methyl ester carboxylesterase